MIQELLGGASSSLLADPKISFNGPPPSHHAFQSCTSQPSSTPSSTTPTATATNNPPSSDDNNNNNSNNNSSNNNSSNNNNNNLRCPRCDSANTKFCYYNNYNLTQPRHFCKTCRRYWTKGGALRNVPIGGGCRKNKSTIVSSTASKSTSASSKLSKPHDDIARAVTAGSTHLGFDHDLIIPNTYSSSNPNNILWGSASPQASSSSHILALLRATSQNPNPNPNHNPVSSHLVKEENNNMVAPHMSGQPLVLNGRAMGLDHLGHQVPSLGLSTPSFWRTNNQNQPQPHQNGTNIALGTDVHNSGMQELYQRLIRSSSSTTTTPTTNDYFTDHHHHHHSNSQPVGLMSNAISSSSSPPVSSMLESAPVASDQLGYGWNVNPAAFSWSDLPTTNGAYP